MSYWYTILKLTVIILCTYIICMMLSNLVPCTHAAKACKCRFTCICDQFTDLPENTNTAGCRIRHARRHRTIDMAASYWSLQCIQGHEITGTAPIFKLIEIRLTNIWYRVDKVTHTGKCLSYFLVIRPISAYSLILISACYFAGLTTRY